MPQTSKYRGVSWNKWAKKWQASGRWNVNGKRVRKSFGYFHDEGEAGRAYEKGMRQLKALESEANVGQVNNVATI